MKILPAIPLALVVGCMSSAPKAPTNWTIDFERSQMPVADAKCDGESVRISTVDVRVPYAGQRLVVLRPDGSVAFDSFNSFAGSPALLLRGAAHDAVEASGKFGRVVESGSAVQTKCAMEIVVTKMALDCRAEGKRMARIDFTLTLLQGREAVAVVRGTGAEEAGDDYSAAFSAAFARAMQDALGKLPVK